MKIIDMHIHARNTVPDPDKLLSDMEKAGIFGGCVFSNPPREDNEIKGSSFEERLNEVLEWSKGHEDRIFPVVWIHPYEENIIENVRKAAEKGVCGFKIICSDFYVYEEKCLEVLREIAKLDKPVFFHSGILWDRKVNEKYNRPFNWEALINIKGLRFSMGHCSWPWVDDCISLYGEYMFLLDSNETAEMFFDITPGTPEIYREELLTKIYTIGYDVGDNIMFGTDASSNNYNYGWTKNWLELDGKIMDKIGVSRENRQKLYRDNFLRFIGKIEKTADKLSVKAGESSDWSCINPDVYAIIKKWYGLLNFPKIYDDEFFCALKNIRISDNITIQKYDCTESDGVRNLLSFLYMCEDLKSKYEEKGIDEKILFDTLTDLVVWTNTWSDIKGGLYLGELSWLKRHLDFKLFRLGRLQFCLGEAEHDIPEENLKKGDQVIEVHIPEGEPLSYEECLKSFALAKKFFSEYFPEYDYKCFTCHTWLLDDTLVQFLNEESNILKFQSLFKPVLKEKSDAIIRYTFKWNATRQMLKGLAPVSSFTQKVKKHIMAGGEFFEVTGIVNK